MDVYENADKTVKVLNREFLREFDRLKLAKWDSVNVIREVSGIYRNAVKKTRKRLWEIAFEAYIAALYECGIRPKEAMRMAEETITEEWLNAWLEETDPVTLYRFDTETDRKKQRLTEALGVAFDKDEEIDKALRYWVKQVGQYAIGSVDFSRIRAFKDADIKKVMWMTERDERVCDECGPLDGEIFDIDKIPPKPHWGCRCVLIPVKG